MEILISFCNVNRPGRPSLGQPLLGRYDPCKRRFSAVEIDVKANGLTGLAASDSHIYAAAQIDPPPGYTNREALPSAILVFDRADLRLVGRRDLSLACDVHSIFPRGESLLMVSTGGDQIVEVDVDGQELSAERIVWSFDSAAPHSDDHHFNSIVTHSGRLLVSAFGNPTGDTWISAKSGFILDIETRKPVLTDIDQPHSIASVKDELAWCESGSRAVCLGDKRIQDLPGYSRGLCVTGNDLYVGTSVARHARERNGAWIENPGSGYCGVSRVSLTDWRLVESVYVPTGFPSEVYDLLVLDDGGRK